MAYDNATLFDKAVEITKEYARSGHTANIDTILENVYNKMVEIAKKGGFHY